MRFTATLAALALSSGAALAQLQVTDSIGASVLQVLATAIPPESISMATADPVAFSSELDSSLSAGNTPAWYQDLPADVKSYLPQLYPAEAPAITTADAGYATSAVEQSYAVPTISPSHAGNHTAISSVAAPTLAPSGTAPASPEFTGAAAIPKSFVHAGLAGAIGILGVLVL